MTDSASPDTNETRPIKHVLRSCCALFATEQVVELRALGLNGRDSHSAAGWFNDFDALAGAAIQAEARQAEGIYATLNPVNPACLARSPNKLKDFQRVTTTDREIVSRQWFPIDLDPVRPSKISSSQAELEAARNRGKEIIAWLEGELGWPRGLRACSSNGIHLLYRVEMPNDDDAKELIRRCLLALSEKFTDQAIKLDTSIFNAARIWKLWGTVSRKGASIADRPHRRSCLWPMGESKKYQEFAEIERLSIDQLQSLAAQYKERARRGIRAGRSEHLKDIDLDRFIAEHEIEVTRSEPWDGSGRRYILARCLFDGSHTGTEAILGKSPTGAVFYRCQHDSCSGKRWSDVRRMFENRETRKKKRTDEANGSSEEEAGKESEKAPQPSPTRRFTENAWDLARDFIREHYVSADGEVYLRRHREKFYAWRPNRGVYVEVSPDALATQITVWGSEHFDKTTIGAVNNVMHSAGANVTAPDDIDMPFLSEIGLGETHPFSRADVTPRRWIAMENGILDVDALLDGRPASKCIHQPSSKWLNTIKLSYAFDIDARCNLWQKFLDEVLEDDEERIAVIQEMFGYCLWDSTELERFFILIGSGANGKSTMMNILEAMLGQQNVSALSPKELEDRTMKFDLYGKLANICTDMDEVDRFSERIIKKVCSGEPLVADRKFKSSVQWRPKTKMIFATNVLPRFVDVTQGIWRRAIIIPFDVQIPANKRDTRLLEKLRGELPGIFLWAIQGMIRILKHREFTKSTECDRTLREYRRQCFPILTFLDEETITEPQGEVLTADLYNAYLTWCKEHGLTKPKPLHMFARDVYQLRGKEVRRGRSDLGDGERRAAIYGIRLRAPQETRSFAWREGEEPK